MRYVVNKLRMNHYGTFQKKSEFFTVEYNFIKINMNTHAQETKPQKSKPRGKKPRGGRRGRTKKLIQNSQFEPKYLISRDQYSYYLVKNATPVKSSFPGYPRIIGFN